MKKNPNWPRIKPGKPGQNGYSALHKRNFNVLLKESFFNPDNTFIDIKVPCPNDKFEIKKVYDISDSIFEDFQIAFDNLKTILIHISDSTASSTLGKEINFFLDGKILFDEVYDPITCNVKRLDLKKHQSLLVIVFNNNDDFCLEEVLEKQAVGKSIWGIFKPEEAGGGVIVTGP